MRWRLPALPILGLALAAGAASACEVPGAPAGWSDRGIAIAADCAFDEAGERYEVTFSGRASVDLGGGRVGQRWTIRGHCTQTEELVVVDCGTLETIAIKGVPYGNELAGGASVDLLYAPRGMIRLSPRSSVAALAQVARRAGYGYSLDIKSRIAAMQPRNRPDPFCGCHLFYPGSAGARA